MSNDSPWDDDSIQFPRLLAEIAATDALTPEVFEQLRELMDLDNNEINELLERAHCEWEEIKARKCPPPAAAVVVPDGNPNEEEDWTLAPRHNLWLTVDDFSVHIIRTGEGIVLDVYAKGCEMDDTLASTYAFTDDARAVIEEASGT